MVKILQWGWEIDHSKTKSKDGTNHPKNLNAM